MRKCMRCLDNSEKEAEAKEAELWQEMIDSLMHFTETSTSLMKGMQGKLGIPPDSDPDKKMCDPCGLLQKVKDELGDMEVEEKESPVCTCTSPSQTFEDSDPEEDIQPGIACYKSPTVIKKKKFKYSSEIESKLMAKKKKMPPCMCNKNSHNLPVDACLCKKLVGHVQVLDKCGEQFCPIKMCSDLTQDEITNIYCVGEVPEEKVGDQQGKVDPLAWIHKPGSFEPDKLPQDDEHPYVIKTQDTFQMRKNSLGYELLEAMKKYGDNIAQIDDSSGAFETYTEYRKKCIQVARKLKTEFSKKDLIGICTTNHKNTYIPYLAGLLNGNRVVAFNNTSNKTDMTLCLENATPCVMFVSADSLAFLRECMEAAKVSFKVVIFGEADDPGLPSFESYLEEGGGSIDDFHAENVEDLESTCLVCFTGGIPEPKAICLSHYGMLRQSYRMISSEHAQPVILSYRDNSQVNSLLALFSSILIGSTRVIVEQFQEENTWKLVQKYEINALHLYPYHIERLSNLPEPEKDTSSLVYIFTGGEKLNLDALAKLKEVLLKTLICQTYEHTELSGIITMFDFSKPEDSIFNYFVNQSSGRPIDGVWYKVVDKKTGKLITQYQQGELFIKSKLTRNGYLIKNKEESHCENSWISTGDLVSFDTCKCFQFVDKIADLIKCKGKFIVPSKLEEILMTHPLVTKAVVVPVPHEEDGQHAAALVTVKENEDIYTKDLDDWMKTKVPEEEQLKGGVKIVGGFPDMVHGKMNRRTLQSMF